MYYEERLVNGVLHWRDTPDGDWIPYTIEAISERYWKLRKALHSGSTK